MEYVFKYNCFYKKKKTFFKARILVWMTGLGSQKSQKEFLGVSNGLITQQINTCTHTHTE